jgi:hypothetical protein
LPLARQSGHIVDDDLSLALASADLATRLPAVDRAAHDPARYAASVVALIAMYPAESYFIFERLGRFAPHAIRPLRSLLDSTDELAVRRTCTLALAHMGAPVDITILTDAIHARSDDQELACRALSRANARETLPFLAAELGDTSPTETWRAVALIDCIHALGGRVAPSEAERLTRGDVDPQLRHRFKPAGTAT